MGYVCRYCNSEFNVRKDFIAHCPQCTANDGLREKRKQQRLRQIHPKCMYVFACKKCNSEFELLLSTAQFNAGKHKIHCSRTCANGRPQTETTRESIRNALKGRHRTPEHKLQHCAYCQTPFERKRKSRKTVCSTDCHIALWKISVNEKQSRVGGYRDRQRFLYKGASFDSKWEVVFAKKLDQENIQWRRIITNPLPYHDQEGKSRLYYPDFFLPEHNLYVEIKGYASQQTEHKMKDAQDRNDIKLMIIRSLKEIESFSLHTLMV